MRLLYRIQQQMSITEYEFRVLLVVCLIFICGLLVKSYHGRPASFPADIYAEDLALLQKGTASWQAAADSVSATTSAAASDSGAAAIASAAAYASGAAADSIAVLTSGDPGRSKASFANSARININTATAAELEQLPRIGPATAARILAQRRRRGAFRTIEDLSIVRGIGPKTLAELKPLVTISSERR